jgi:hypothetical protein
MSKVELLIGVTGHRDLLESEEGIIKQKVQDFFLDLQKRYPDLPLHVLTSLAEGADSLVADVALEAGLKVTSVLPMPEALYLEDFQGQAKEDFQRLNAASESWVLSPSHWGINSDRQEIPSNEIRREIYYERAGRFLAAHSHILLALWDGSTNGAVGGTSHVVEFHQRDAETEEDPSQARTFVDIGDDESDLVYHIVCSRRSSGAPVESLSPGDAMWFTRNDVTPREEELPDRYHRVFKSLAEFNQDLNLVAGQSFYSLHPESAHDAKSEFAGKVCDDIQKIYGACDALATTFQKRTVYAVKTTLSCAILAGLSFIVYADLFDFPIMIAGYFFFVALATASFYVAEKQNWQKRYLDYRALAEGLRVQYYWALAGVNMLSPNRYSHDSVFDGRELELGWIRHVMRFTGLHADLTESTATHLDLAIATWIDDENQGQLHYFKRAAKRSLLSHQTTQRITVTCFASGMVLAAMLALNQGLFSGLVMNCFIAMIGLLPIVAAARQSYSHRLAERELAGQYSYMHELFSNASRFIEQAETVEIKQTILRDLGEAALRENSLWLLRQRERPLPVTGSVG